MTAARAATLGRAAHTQACGGVEQAHNAGVLTGAAFNRVKDICIQADSIMDAGDAALMADQESNALAQYAKAQSLIAQVQQ